MKQLVQSFRTGELQLVEVPAPVVQRNDVLVEVATSLVSVGTERMLVDLARKSLVAKARSRPDLVERVIAKMRTDGLRQTVQQVRAKLSTPIPLGYSCAGEVLEVGPGVSDLKPGDRVACGGAGYATHAEINRVPKNLCAKLPDRIGFEEACFATLGAIAMQGVRQADIRLGERVVVIGLGLLGLLSAQLLRAAGCSVLGSDIDPRALEVARKLGFDVCPPGELAKDAAAFTHGYGADAVIVTAATSSDQPLSLGARVSRMKGRIVVVGQVGMRVPRDAFYAKELDLRLSMSYGPGRYDASYEEGGHDYPFGYVRWTEQRNMQGFLELVAKGVVRPGDLVTHRFEISDALAAYALLAETPADGEKPLAIVINYPLRRSMERRVVTDGAVPAIGRNTVAVGFIGGGNFTKGVLLPALERVGGVKLVGLCTATGFSSTETAKRRGFAYATTDYREILEDNLIDAVFVTTQHDTHAKIASAALSAGKHVFVEKPLCIDDNQLQMFEQVFASLDGGRPCLMVGFNRRFSRHARCVREVFQRHRGPLAVVYRVNAGAIPRDSWIQDPERGGGRVIGEVCHFVDLCEFWIGSVPRRVHAACIGNGDSRMKPEDTSMIVIEYEDGSLATIHYLAVGSTRLAKERIEIYGDGVTAVIDDFHRTDFYGTSQRAVRGKDKGFDSELREFLGVVRHGGPWPIPFESVAHTTRVTFAAAGSLRIGRPTWLGCA